MNFHPRTSGLGLANERVVLMSASNIRCSVVTESGKVATWMDESLSHVCAKLEQSATAYPDLFGGGGDKILSLHTCVLFTAVRTESGNIFWWGILPFQQRKKLIEKYTNKKKSASGSTTLAAAAAAAGSRVAAASSAATRAATSRRVRSGMVGIALTTSASHATAHQASASASAAAASAAAAAAASEITLGSQVRNLG